jgi:uncharacterized membrane protein YjgN (DUF898 family)
MNVHIIPEQPRAGSVTPMHFLGRGRSFLGLLIRGALLQIPTFGFYRFWLITRIRRHLWGQTAVGTERFDYTGTGKELLVGFLVAIAILVPINLLYFLAAILLEERAAFASAPLALIIYALGHYGSFRARRYRSTRTTFRGLRFWMTGSGWSYAAQAIKWDVLIILSLGLALPWALAALERFRMRNTYFGTLQGNFVGEGRDLFRRGIWLWLAYLGLVLGGILGLGVIVKIHGDQAKGLVTIIAFAIAIVAAILWPVYMAIRTRWQIEGLRLDGVALTSSLKASDFMGTFAKLITSSIGLVIVFAGFIALFMVTNETVRQEFIGGAVGKNALVSMAALGLGYLILLLSIGVVQRYFMLRGLWAVTAGSITVHNLEILEQAVAAGAPSNAVGEGIAEALDFGASF